ncbi:MAG: hypothetical protein Q9177_006523, partial [Variospora cf. flavescens]
CKQKRKRTEKSKNIAGQANHERQAGRWPSALIHEHSENTRRISVGRHIHKGNQDGEESQDMDNQDEAFELGE